MLKSKLKVLRNQAISRSLFNPASLEEAIHRLSFVQADPIRAPAAAQDLILRHRVKSYRAGDLERFYTTLDVEEDLFYAYGFLPRTVWQLLHPRKKTALSKLEKKVLDAVLESGETHPRELELSFGADRVVNAWGGYSKATKQALEELHYRGFLRIARREKGIRVYAPASAIAEQTLLAAERARKLVMVVAGILEPLPLKSLKETLTRVRHSVAEHLDINKALDELLRSGDLCQETVDNLVYVWTPKLDREPEELPRCVRFLAPFDPLVWDRRRFEHFWEWPYRFEAYVPASKRERGYYAMPLLFGDSMIGWANAVVSAGSLTVELGFVGKRPREAIFRSELDNEIERLKIFLDLK